MKNYEKHYFKQKNIKILRKSKTLFISGLYNYLDINSTIVIDVACIYIVFKS